MVAVHHVGRCGSSSSMKHRIQLSYLICFSLIEVVSTARGSRFYRSRSLRTYYSTSSGGDGDDESWIYIIAVILGLSAIAFCCMGIFMCYKKLKERRARKVEEAKELEKKSQNIQHKRSRNVVGTAEF